MLTAEIIVVGAGPAGLSAAAEASHWNAGVTVFDRDATPGGQLVKQTHRFFGSRAQRAGTRGIDIIRILLDEIGERENARIVSGADVVSRYDDGVLGIAKAGHWFKAKPERLILATGAAEKTLAFPGSDLPGVYGAGAVQTLMNVHGVRPGQHVLMVGAGNIGLIVAYQLIQAGVEVVGVVEASERIGGYWVHASKIRRLKIPIFTRHTILQARGKESVEGAIIAEVGGDWAPIESTRRELSCDAICLAVGLSPLVDLMWQSGCSMSWISELGGYVPARDPSMGSDVDGVYVAGDAAGIEEASAAMMEGRIAGLSAAHSLGKVSDEQFGLRAEEIGRELANLRSGPTGEVVRRGLSKLERAPRNSQVLVEGGDSRC